MNPLLPDQLQALERAAADMDHCHEASTTARLLRDVADWSIWECVVVQGLSVRRTAHTLHLKRGLVRMAIGRVSRELQSSSPRAMPDDALQLYPPRAWDDNELR